MFNALRRILNGWFGTTVAPGNAVTDDPDTELIATPPRENGDQYSAGVVPYDENLLERARTQWQFGDWESLAALDHASFEQHPERGKLALLAAAGRMQNGRNQQAREYVQLAAKWGCGKRLLAQMMISNVHNTLGKAAAIAQRHEKATRHFEHALRTGSPGSETRLQVQARMSEQMAQLQALNLSKNGSSALLTEQKARHLGAAQLGNLEENACRSFATKNSAELEAYEQTIKDIEGQLSANFAKELGNAVKQIEAFLRLQNYLGLNAVLPDTHNWAVSPDFGVLLIQLVEQNVYDAVVEFGSGTSTLVLAKALERVAERRGQPIAPLLSFDHLEKFQEQSQRQLEQAGLSSYARVVLAPLQVSRSTETPYYACEEMLCQFRNELGQASPRVLVVVDGPPGRTGPKARRPALSKVLKSFGDACHFHFLMDDYDRQDERDIMVSWEQGLTKIDRVFTRTEFKQLEKQACLLDVPPPNKTSE